MFLLDDILLFPITGLLFIVNKINDAAQEELVNEATQITTQLSELYMMLETKQITEEEFDAREKILLDRLDELKEQDEAEGDADIEEEEDEEEDDEEEEAGENEGP